MEGRWHIVASGVWVPLVLLLASPLNAATESRATAATDKVPHHSSQLLVKIRSDVGWIIPQGTKYRRKDERTGIGLLSITDGSVAGRRVRELQSQGLFDFVELDHVVSLDSARGPSEKCESAAKAFSCPWTPDDEMWAYQWGPIATQADRAWCHTTGEGTVVAVIDTGIDLNHPDLKANLWVNEAEAFGIEGEDDDGNGFIDDVHGYDFVNDQGNMFDDHIHGTHVAGIIAGIADNRAGIAGVAPGAKIMPLKFMDETGTGYISRAVFAVLYAVQHNADVISNSWGSAVKSQALEVAYGATLGGGQLVTCSAGNLGEPLDYDASMNYPASFRFPNMIVVAAATQSLSLSTFSNYGVYSVDIAAPGEDILSSAPMFRGGYARESGTSQAVPHVSGAAALVTAAGWAAGHLNASMAPLQRALWVRAAILQSVTYVPALAPFVRSAGLVNAYAAVRLAARGGGGRTEAEELSATQAAAPQNLGYHEIGKGALHSELENHQVLM